MVEAAGTVKGTTSTVERSDDEASGAVLFMGCVVDVMMSMARLVLPATSSNARPPLSAWAEVEGIGMLWDASRTEYWRSHIKKTISRAGDLVSPASKTKVEPSDSKEISLRDFAEGPACVPDAKAESDVRWIGSKIGMMLIVSSADSNW